jgi:hypothetical protein
MQKCFDFAKIGAFWWWGGGGGLSSAAAGDDPLADVLHRAQDHVVGHFRVDRLDGVHGHNLQQEFFI